MLHSTYWADYCTYQARKSTYRSRKSTSTSYVLANNPARILVIALREGLLKAAGAVHSPRRPQTRSNAVTVEGRYLARVQISAPCLRSVHRVG